MSRNIILYDPDSQVPKYRQIIQSVKWAIERKMLKKGDKIPSINQVCSTYHMSRDTVMLAYNDLKSHGIISSNKGKGYFVDSTDTRHVEKVFLQLDELNGSKEEFYNSFHESLHADASIDVFIHQFNYQLFKTQLNECNGKYTSYVIMPAHFDNICHLIQKLPVDRVYILDRLKPELNGYPSVYQDFESDVYENLQKVKAELSKYRRMIFVQGGGKEPVERVAGFKRFCVENKIEFRIVRSLTEIRPALYDVFLVPSDRTLVEILKLAREYEFELGTKFGIISFNDSVLKEVVAGGITTISTDFAQMGKSLAEMVLNRKIRQIKNASRIVIRNSL